MVNYSCERCGKCFGQKSHWIKHTQYKKYPCVSISVNSNTLEYAKSEPKCNDEKELGAVGALQTLGAIGAGAIDKNITQNYRLTNFILCARHMHRIVVLSSSDITMSEQVLASNIQYGDVIAGPDGESTVTCIRGNDNFIQFDFAEGNGNRCWLVPQTTLITRYRETSCAIPSGFAVDHEGEVIESYIGTVMESRGVLLITRADATTATLERKEVHHISGNFTMVF